MPTLYLWTVYASPRDFPGKYVARKFACVDGRELATSERLLANSLDEIRRALPRGLYRITRHPSDDPVIVETWL